MKIRRENVRSYLLPPTTGDERAFVREYLTIDTGRRNHTDGSAITYGLHHDLSDSFPSGFFPLVKRAAEKEGLTVEVEDTRAPRLVPDASVDLTWLREDQRAAVAEVERLRRGIIKLPTGAGKTEVAVALGLRLPAPMLFLVDSVDLMEQAAARWEKRTGLPAGRFGDGQHTTGGRFTSGTFATMRLALGSKAGKALLRAFRVLVVDECHGLPADTHYAVAAACREADYRVGLSATPFAGDPVRAATLTGLLGPIVYEVSTQELTSAGVIAKARVVLVKHEHVSAAEQWAAAYRECIVEDAERNRKVVAVARRCPKPALVFVRAVEHGRELLRLLLRAGLRTEFMYGAKSSGSRATAAQRLMRNDLDVIVCNAIWYKGVDLPALASAVNAAGGASDIDTLQRLGRGTRVVRNSAGEVVKGAFEYFDLFDTGHPWTEKHSRNRRAAYREEGHEVVVEEADPAQLTLPREAVRLT